MGGEQILRRDAIIFNSCFCSAGSVTDLLCSITRAGLCKPRNSRGFCHLVMATGTGIVEEICPFIELEKLHLWMMFSVKAGSHRRQLCRPGGIFFCFSMFGKMLCTFSFILCTFSSILCTFSFILSPSCASELPSAPPAMNSCIPVSPLSTAQL